MTTIWNKGYYWNIYKSEISNPEQVILEFT